MALFTNLSRLVVEGLLYRSARPGTYLITNISYQTIDIPDDATLSDRRRLQDDYAIRTIMDLRTK